MAQSRHELVQCTGPLSGAKQTSASLTTRQFIHLKKNRNFSDPHHSRTRGAILKWILENTSMRDPHVGQLYQLEQPGCHRGAYRRTAPAPRLERVHSSRRLPTAFRQE